MPRLSPAAYWAAPLRGRIWRKSYPTYSLRCGAPRTGWTKPVRSADDLLAADDAEGPEAQALRREQAETLRRLLLEMAADDREIFVRFYYYRQTVHEIASVMERNESTVKARLARGRARLRDKLTKEVDGYADP